MPLLNALEFTRAHLAVAYRASEEEQEVKLDFKLKQRAKRPNASGMLLGQCVWIRAGLAGSDVFDPCTGHAEIVSGPLSPPGVFGPSYRYLMKVRGVAPIYLRLFVEKLRAVGFDIPVVSCSIIGALPGDDSPLSCTEATVKKWLDDPAAYPKAWSKLAFEHKVLDQQGKSLTVRTTFKRPLGDEARKRYETNWGSWNNVIAPIISTTGQHVPVKLGQSLPVHAFAKREATTHIEVFERARPPCIALALNMLHRFHVEHAPVASVEFKT